MKKTFRQLEPGTAAYVVAHATYMASRGKNPSQPFLAEKNPRKALASAKVFVTALESQEFVGGIMASLGKDILSDPAKPSYYEMQQPDIEAALRHIVTNSSSEEEVKTRVKSELGCPYTPTVRILSALSKLGTQVHQLCAAMGGVTLKTGELVQVMLWGPRGECISL